MGPQSPLHRCTTHLRTNNPTRGFFSTLPFAQIAKRLEALEQGLQELADSSRIAPSYYPTVGGGKSKCGT